MLHVLKSLDRRQVIFGRYRNGEGIQKKEVEIRQDHPHLLALKGHSLSMCYSQADAR